jgi:alpha-beta hydrolase superfamily lysophospholipase
MAQRARTVNPLRPTELGSHEGLSYSLWIPDRALAGGVTIIHGALSCKENHHDFARACVAAGLAAIAFDLRGHGSSEGPLDGRILDDVAEIAALLRVRTARPDLPVALRGSSLGGYLAIRAAWLASAAAVVAICPASDESLRQGTRSGRFDFDLDRQALEALVFTRELFTEVESLQIPLLLLHAEGDEQISVEHSRELAQHARVPGSRLVTVPGGHHRMVQHDPELQALTLRWIAKTFPAVAQ